MAFTEEDKKFIQETIAGEINGLDSKLSGQITGLNSKLSGQIAGLNTKLSGQITGLNTKLSGQIAGLDIKLSQKIDELGRKQETMTKEIIDINNKIYRRFDMVTDDIAIIATATGVKLPDRTQPRVINHELPV